ncbi:hypothetical protein R1sor_010078 [Riccia sorocarpa]|uniref:BHLH domain-containing protein n=1 Tax=Riccia sorocarpa TaxID=122646 RepID=A0ABD3HWZ0_9MARC
MHSILGRGRSSRPGFQGEVHLQQQQGWDEVPSSNASATAQSHNFHVEPLFGTPSGSLQDILRSVQSVEAHSAFVTVVKPSTCTGSQQPHQPAEIPTQQAIHLRPDSIPTTRNVEVQIPVTVIDDDGGLEKLQTSALQRKQLQRHPSTSSSTWDPTRSLSSGRNENALEAYNAHHAHVRLAEISSSTTLQQLDSFKSIGSWSTATQAAPHPPAGGDHVSQQQQQQRSEWTDLRRSVDNVSSQPSNVWSGERWSIDNTRVAPSSAERNLSASAAAPAAPPVAQMEESTDGGSDPVDERVAQRWSSTAGYCSSRNLFSERKRRKKMNDGLYSLRSLVPNISKMDKASIIADAIKYVMELERQVKELESEIELDEQRQNKLKACLDQLGSSSTATTVRQHEVCTASAIIEAHDDAAQTEKDQNRSKNSRSSAVSTVNLKDQPNITLEVSRMKNGMYSLRLLYQQQPGIFIHMSQVIESLDLHILQSHVSTCDGYVVHSLIAKV